MATGSGAGPGTTLDALLAELGLLPGNCPPAEAQARLLLALADERERYIRRILRSWHEGYAAGREAGWRDGYQASEASHDSELDATRQMLRAAVAPVLDPDGSARRRVHAAEAAEKRDQAEHERNFAARAHATPDRLRNDVQRATVHAYPPPLRTGRVIPLARGRRGKQAAGG